MMQQLRECNPKTLVWDIGEKRKSKQLFYWSSMYLDYYEFLSGIPLLTPPPIVGHFFVLDWSACHDQQ